jgi:hypothetical protein
MYGKVGASVLVAYTNDGYLRDAYRYLQVSHRGLWKLNWSGLGFLAFGGYKDVYISPSR